MAIRWEELKHKNSAERRQANRQEAKEDLERLGFGKLRQARATDAGGTGGEAGCAAGCDLSDGTADGSAAEHVATLCRGNGWTIRVASSLSGGGVFCWSRWPREASVKW